MNTLTRTDFVLQARSFENLIPCVLENHILAAERK